MSIIRLEDKFLTTFAKVSPSANRLAQLLKEYKTTTDSFNDLTFCEARSLPLSELYVGTEMPEQRPISLNRVIKILENFTVYNVCPILVHKKNDKLLVWDGQHTAVALIALAKFIYKEPLDTCFVPVAIYDFHGNQFRRSGFGYV